MVSANLLGVVEDEAGAAGRPAEFPLPLPTPTALPMTSSAETVNHAHRHTAVQCYL